MNCTAEKPIVISLFPMKKIAKRLLQWLIKRGWLDEATIFESIRYNFAVCRVCGNYSKECAFCMDNIKEDDINQVFRTIKRKTEECPTPRLR